MKNPIIWLTQDQCKDACLYGVSPIMRSFFNIEKLASLAPSAMNAFEYEYVKEPLPYLKRVIDGGIFPLPLYILDLDEYRINDVSCDLDALTEYWSQLRDVTLLSGLGSYKPEGVVPHMLNSPINGDEPGLGYVIYQMDHHIEESESRPEASETIGAIFYLSLDDFHQASSWVYHKNQEKNKTKAHRCYNVMDYIIRDIWKARQFLKESEYQMDAEEPKRRFKCYNI